ncbi:MAG: hypothetical protein LQ350_003379 [Teloschistes chrysophthalmus]|nr:MAG: hypothetical protein LQ350_003379 [Niorma chrysophthalma]
MALDDLYESCLPILEDNTLEGEERTEGLEQLLAKEHSLSGQALEDAVLNVLWRFRDAADPSTASPPVRHTIIRKSSPAPWQIPQPSSGLASPSLSAVVPASLSNRPGFMRSKSYGASPFGSPRPSPRLAFASPVPHSPQLESYQFSEPGDVQNDYGDITSDNVDWLLNDEPRSRPSSSGTGAGSVNDGSSYEAQQNEMSPYDMLRSVLGDDRSDEDIEAALAANSYDLSMTLMSLMGSQMPYQQDQTLIPQSSGGMLIGKSMVTERPAADQSVRGRNPVICKYFLSGGRCMRADCRFSHDLSGHVCKYWLMGNCLAGESCIFSHDPALLLNTLSMDDGSGVLGSSPSQTPSFQVQDYDAFPSLHNTAGNQHVQVPFSSYQPNSLQYSGSPLGNNYMGGSRRTFEQRPTSASGLSSSPGSFNSRPGSRHRSRDQSPYIPVEDSEAFPTLGSVVSKGPRKHHGKRGGHGHGSKENAPNSLADVVRMSPSPAPALLRKGLSKNRSYAGTREASLAAAAIPAPEHVPWLETGEKTNQAYLKARHEAFRHGASRNRFLQSAAQAWNRNDARAAKALSLRGQSENDLMRKAHREAAKLLYEERNKEGSTSKEIYIDLHGLHPEEAIEYLEQVLIQHQKSTRPVYAITGTGHHSKNGKDKVGKAIRGWLSEWKYAYAEFNVPGDNLGGILGIDPASFDKRLVDEKTSGEQIDGPVEESLGGKIRLVKEMTTTRGVT